MSSAPLPYFSLARCLEALVASSQPRLVGDAWVARKDRESGGELDAEGVDEVGLGKKEPTEYRRGVSCDPLRLLYTWAWSFMGSRWTVVVRVWLSLDLRNGALNLVIDQGFKNP